MRKINGRDFVREILSQNPYLSQEDLSERIFSADRRSYPYWVTLIMITTIRYSIGAAAFLASAVGYLISEGITYTSKLDLLLKGAMEAKNLLLVDLAFVIIGMLAFRSNPKSLSIVQIIESDSWSRCKPRVGNFLFWSLLPYAIIYFAALLIKL